MRLFIEPMEPLIFRTARPFQAGENNFAESLFPPTPETMQGAVRAAIATYWHPDKNIAAAFRDPQLTKLIGDREVYGRFRLTGLALGRYSKTDEAAEVERLFPTPAHLVTTGDDQPLLRLLPHQLEAGIRSNLPEGITYSLKSQERLDDSLQSVGGWLTEKGLREALGTGTLSTIKIVHKEDIYQEEPRLGIGIQRDTKTTEEGYLYQMLMIRMNHKLEHNYRYGFVVEIDLDPLRSLNDEQVQQELHLPSSGWMTIGGEQRAAHFRVLRVAASEELDKRSRTERTLLYLATPASFKTGWKPSPQFAPLDAPLTAAIHRYESIGGWKLNQDNAGGESKVMRRCVPAGSVYFFNQKISLDRPLTDDGMEIGYGITFEGEW